MMQLGDFAQDGSSSYIEPSQLQAKFQMLRHEEFFFAYLSRK